MRPAAQQGQGQGAQLNEPMYRRRLREEHSDPRSREFLARLRLPADARCAEFGAGMGSMARWVATELAPRGMVLATEARPGLVDLVGRPDIGNLRAVRHDLRSEPFPEQDLDLIYGRYVLEHLPERDEIIGRLVRHLRPGGWLVVEDASFVPGMLTGPDDYRSAMLGFAEVRPASDFRWADELPRQMQNAGLRDVRAQRLGDLFSSGSDIARFWAALLTQETAACVAAGTADQATIERAIDLLLNGATWFGGPSIVQCAGRYVSEGPAGERS